jgi:amino acid transporter
MGEEEEVVFVRRASGLVRELEWYDVAIWALSAACGSGVTYYAVKMLGSAPGGNTILAFILAALMYIPLIMAIAVIGASFPRAGSLYVLISRVVHPVLGFLSNWMWVMIGGGLAICGLMSFLGVKTLAGPLVAAGVIAKSPELISIAESLASLENQVIVAIVIVIVMWLLNIFGIRVLKWLQRIITVTPFVLSIVLLLWLIPYGMGGSVNNWDSFYGAGSAQKIVTLATTGSVDGISIDTPMTVGEFWGSTYSMLLWTIWAFTAIETSTYVGSEVKNPKKSFLKGYLVGFLAVVVLYILISSLISWSYPVTFLESYSYLQMNYRGQLEQLIGGVAPDPSVPFFTAISIGNFYIAILIGIVFFLWYLNSIVAVWLASVRGIFAMAFDRSLPESLANVSSSGAPTWANHIGLVVGILGVLFATGDSMGFSWASSVIAYADFSCIWWIWLVGLSLMLMPFFRRDLYERCVWQIEIRGIPAMSIIGALVFAVGWFFVILTSYTEPLIVLMNILVSLIGLLIFTYQQYRNVKRGIDVRKIYTEIPPA